MRAGASKESAPIAPRTVAAPVAGDDAAQRAASIAAVAEHGTRAIAPPLARREAWRRRTLSIPWQLLIVCAAVIEMAGSLAGSHLKDGDDRLGARLATAFGLAIFVSAPFALRDPRPRQTCAARCRSIGRVDW